MVSNSLVVKVHVGVILAKFSASFFFPPKTRKATKTFILYSSINTIVGEPT